MHFRARDIKAEFQSKKTQWAGMLDITADHRLTSIATWGGHYSFLLICITLSIENVDMISISVCSIVYVKRLA